MDSCCRICLKTKDSDLRNLEESTHNEENLKSMYLICTSINIDNDTFSRFICKPCEDNLIVAYDFRTLAQASFEKLQNWTSSGNHNETDDRKFLDFANNGDDSSDAKESFHVKVEVEEEKINVTKAMKKKNPKKHSQEKTRVCPGCQMKFHRHSELLAHMKARLAQSDHQYHCNECGSYFKLKNSIKMHVLLHRKGRFACDQCDKQYSQPGTLATHKKVEHSAPGTAPMYFCPTCGRGFTRAQTMANHIRMVHLRVIKAICKVCKKGFVSNSQMKVHMRKHTGDQPYQCEVCAKRFTTVGGFNTHRDSAHIEERNFPCDMCQMKFKHRHNLATHRKFHFPDSKFNCDECTVSYRSRAELADHKNIHTGLKPHKCETCGLDFHEKSAMKRHQKTEHSGVTYRCQHCDKTYKEKKIAEKHALTHGPRERTKVCSFPNCGRAFYEKSDVTRHEREVHMGLRKSKPQKQ